MVKGMTRPVAELLLGQLGSEEAFFSASDSLISALVGTRPGFVNTTVRREALEAAAVEWEYISNAKIGFLYFTDDNYPAKLLECEDAPLALYYIGQADIEDARCLSVVGTRHATSSGIALTENIISDLSRKVDDLVIISGLAYGIDIAAHRAAMNSGARTIAVVAHGLNTIYPAAHRQEAAKIVRNNGAIITEYPHTAAIHRANFLARNRIIAGMADGLLVVESNQKGGAMVTARLARAYNRDVMAIPGRPADTYSQGCNSLIKQDIAGLVTCADDIIHQLGWPTRPPEGTQTTIQVNLSAEEQKIYDYLVKNGEGRLNSMSVQLDIPMSRLVPSLVNLEFNGMIISAPGARYIPLSKVT